jgi:hypothetical protein
LPREHAARDNLAVVLVDLDPFAARQFGRELRKGSMMGAFVPVGTGEIHVTYLNRDSSGGGTDANDAKQFTLGYMYFLSKRTALYGNAGRLRARSEIT